MNTRYEQFIGFYENAFSKEYCDAVIKYYEDMVSAGHGITRQQADSSTPKLVMNDQAVFAHSEALIGLNKTNNLIRHFNDVFWNRCYADYADKFAILKGCGPHRSYCFKIQKTEPGQGYHIWHTEASDRELSVRILVWSLYLNDIEEGGETEFLYQSLRAKPKTGTVLIWPASFTHTHRGNPPLSGIKYIVTGWIEY